jgi:hypothetical protein
MLWPPRPAGQAAARPEADGVSLAGYDGDGAEEQPAGSRIILTTPRLVA